jgi:hypothetical protein
MKDWLKYGLQGWISAFLIYLLVGNLLLVISGQEGIGISFRLVAANFVLGFLPGIIGGKFLKKNWGAYFGGSIIPISILIFLLFL